MNKLTWYTCASQFALNKVSLYYTFRPPGGYITCEELTFLVDSWSLVIVCKINIIVWSGNNDVCYLALQCESMSGQIVCYELTQ